MKSRFAILLCCSLAFTSCEKEFLETPPLDQLTDESYWSSESNVRTFSYGFYPAYFTGYGSSFTWGDYFSGQSLNDDFAPTSPNQFRQNIPTAATSTYWTFAWVRKANIFINRIQNVPMDGEAKGHWTGIGRFFRALEYSDLVNSFGDVPWYEGELEANETEKLYKPRDSRTFVMDNVLADFKYAAENVRVNDGTKGLTVNKDVVLAFMSRVFLFEGTWQKYHENNTAKATEYLEAAKWAAEQVMNSGRYSVSPSYRSLFNSLSLTGNPEVILFRQYEVGVLTHALNSYNNKEPQTGPSKDAIESYLASDGLPIAISPLYQGDKSIAKIMANRDPRIKETFVSTELRLNGIASNYSTSGIATHKFLNESIKDSPEGSSNLNPTDAPVIRYGEVLLNYAEAAAELNSLTQGDLDRTINLLRARPGVNMPPLQVMGNQPAVNGTVYDDPERDPTVSPLIWEIRRERRIELMMEGFRLDDLRRWKKLEYTDTEANIDINRGAWIRKADYPKLQSSVVLTGGDEGYIIPAAKAASMRRFVDPKVYLEPIPLDQIKLYKDQGVELKQNPGW